MAFSFCACAAASAARACSIFAAISGASRMARVSPACTVCPSLTRNSSIRPGTLLDTRYSSTSACPWIISGPLRSMKKPTTATRAITPKRVRNASSILLFCDFCDAIFIYNLQFTIEITLSYVFIIYELPVLSSFCSISFLFSTFRSVFNYEFFFFPLLSPFSLFTSSFI